MKNYLETANFPIYFIAWKAQERNQRFATLDANFSIHKVASIVFILAAGVEIKFSPMVEILALCHCLRSRTEICQCGIRETNKKKVIFNISKEKMPRKKRPDTRNRKCMCSSREFQTEQIKKHITWSYTKTAAHKARDITKISWKLLIFFSLVRCKCCWTGTVRSPCEHAAR